MCLEDIIHNPGIVCDGNMFRVKSSIRPAIRHFINKDTVHIIVCFPQVDIVLHVRYITIAVNVRKVGFRMDISHDLHLVLLEQCDTSIVRCLLPGICTITRTVVWIHNCNHLGAARRSSGNFVVIRADAGGAIVRRPDIQGDEQTTLPTTARSDGRRGTARDGGRGGVLRRTGATEEATMVPHFIPGARVLDVLRAPRSGAVGDPAAVLTSLAVEKVGVIDAGAVPAGGFTRLEHATVSLRTALRGFLPDVFLARIVPILERELFVVHADEGVGGGRPEEGGEYRAEEGVRHPELTNEE
mmetsp:Transcript_42191/g.82788  ORF Transcript_42191/g.82788 Transcript_42191/m.82788 type:complete len:299 (-) Transcript_42191:48-944(-)